ncbi:uncharacterized protein RJT21DRAFT_112820 [Scheffersomyces amazonensis]|uniref:uncharacterized protein n=1 Tax=Scheffersomyces amazonensis TaxID=1078765 RepID=UPI00315D0042
MNLQYSFSTTSLLSAQHQNQQQQQQQQHQSQQVDQSSSKQNKLISKLKILTTYSSTSSPSASSTNIAKHDYNFVNTNPPSPTSLTSMKFTSKSSNSSPMATSIASFGSVSYNNTSSAYSPITPPSTNNYSSSNIRLRSNSLPNFATTKSKYKHQNLLSKYTNKHQNQNRMNNAGINGYNKPRLNPLQRFHNNIKSNSTNTSASNGKFPSFSTGDNFKYLLYSDDEEDDDGDSIQDSYTNSMNERASYYSHYHNNVVAGDDVEYDNEHFTYSLKHMYKDDNDLYEILNSSTPPPTIDSIYSNHHQHGHHHNHQLSDSTRASSISNYQDDEMVMIPPLPETLSSASDSLSHRPSLSSSLEFNASDQHQQRQLPYHGEYAFTTSSHLVTPISTNVNEINNNSNNATPILGNVNMSFTENLSTNATTFTNNPPLIKPNYSLSVQGSKDHIEEVLEEDNVDKLANSILNVVKINDEDSKSVEWGI